MLPGNIWGSTGSSPAIGSCIGNRGEGCALLVELQYLLPRRLSLPSALRGPFACIQGVFREPRRFRPTLNLWSEGTELVVLDQAPVVVLVLGWGSALLFALPLEELLGRL